MPSPFAKFANLTLLLDLPTASAMGNLGYLEAEVEPLIVIAFAKNDAGAQRQQIQDGEMSRMVLSGRCVNPMQIPQGLQPEQKAQAILWRIQKPFRLPASFASVAAYEAFVEANEANIVLRGDFFLAPNFPGSVGVEAKVGDNLRGSLTVRVGWGDVL